MKRERRLTRRERKAKEASTGGGGHSHIHCVACGRHIEPDEFTSSPVRANYVRCQHGTKYAACKACVPQAMALLREHDRTGRPVQAAQVWH